MELKDLKQSVTEMPTDELMALLKDIRQSRRTPKRVHGESKPKAAAKPKKAASSQTLEAMMASMSPADLLAILQKAKKE